MSDVEARGLKHSSRLGVSLWLYDMLYKGSRPINGFHVLFILLKGVSLIKGCGSSSPPCVPVSRAHFHCTKVHLEGELENEWKEPLKATNLYLYGLS
ncbi:hypothetical protein KP509_23G005200 [Ceratopteris richardii]|nr:hypothetical protein KP509_23G005200 [Ceratopteris richardii]